MAAAALQGAVAGKAVAAEAAGVIRGVINALEKPIWSNQETTTVTHVAQNGDVITRTRTKGWTVPLGLPVLVVGTVAAWEIGTAIAKAFDSGGNVASITDQMNPANWNVGTYVGGLLLGPLGALLGGEAAKGTPSVGQVLSRPGSAMASLSNLVQNAIDPVASLLGGITVGVKQ